MKYFFAVSSLALLCVTAEPPSLRAFIIDAVQAIQSSLDQPDGEPDAATWPESFGPWAQAMAMMRASSLAGSSMGPPPSPMASINPFPQVPRDLVSQLTGLREDELMTLLVYLISLLEAREITPPGPIPRPLRNSVGPLGEAIEQLTSAVKARMEGDSGNLADATGLLDVVAWMQALETQAAALASADPGTAVETVEGLVRTLLSPIEAAAQRLQLKLPGDHAMEAEPEGLPLADSAEAETSGGQAPEAQWDISQVEGSEQ